MTPKKEHYVAMAALLLAMGASGLLGYVTQSRFFILPALIAGIAYAVWNLTFACRKCGTPYLYESKGIFVAPTIFPKLCRKCGWPTNQRYDPKD
ncbi:hypothetical protein ACTJK4_25055 [Ralstonia sp. 22111]|uniref:hypothetical protein n=1 Tax=Ralstonia sp. 22111 TaxID=3453878 RepID=UPI003F85F9F5